MSKITSNGRLLNHVNSLTPAASFTVASNNTDMQNIISTMERLMHWAAVIESSDDAIISLSVDGNITGWNQAAERLYGYKSDEVIGKPVSNLMPTQKANDFPMIIERIRQGKKIEHYITQRKTKNGRLIDVSITASPIKDSRGNIIGISKIAHDISERMENERRRDEFVSIVSHELRTPIASQKIYVELLEQQILKGDASQYEMLIHKVKQQTFKLEKLVSDLLELSRLHMGRIKLAPHKFDLNKLISEVVEDVQKTCSHKLQFSPVGPIKVEADKDRVGQVLANLLSNAVKYSPDADKVKIRAMENKNEVVISVQDHGIGIKAEYTDKIFDRFFRINGEDETTYPGMGIGLNVSSEIIGLHGGKMWVESKEGKGSTFYASLPKQVNHGSKEFD